MRLIVKATVLTFFCAGLSAPVSAQTITVTRSPSATAPVLGSVVRGSTATTLSISTSGAVTRPSGNAVRVSSTAVTPPTITVNCSGSLTCLSKDIRITVVVAGASGSSTISKLRVGSLTGASYRTGAPAESTSLTFDLQPIGYGDASFVIGMDVLVPAGAAIGAQTYSYTVTATRL